MALGLLTVLTFIDYFGVVKLMHVKEGAGAPSDPPLWSSDRACWTAVDGWRSTCRSTGDVRMRSVTQFTNLTRPRKWRRSPSAGNPTTHQGRQPANRRAAGRANVAAVKRRRSTTAVMEWMLASLMRRRRESCLHPVTSSV